MVTVVMARRRRDGGKLELIQSVDLSSRPTSYFRAMDHGPAPIKQTDDVDLYR